MLQSASSAESAPRARRSLAAASWAPIVLLAMVAVVLYASGAERGLSLETLQDHRGALQAFVAAHTAAALLAFAGVYTLMVLLSVPGATVMTLAGGLLFGPWAGAAATLAAATLGATGVYGLARSSIGALLLRRAQSRTGRLERIAEGFRRDAFFYLLSLRLAPAVPFWVVNIVAGAGRAPARAFLGATILGMAPATLIYSLVGAGLGRALATGSRPTFERLIDPTIMLPLFGLALLSLVPVLLRRFVPHFREPPNG